MTILSIVYLCWSCVLGPGAGPDWLWPHRWGQSSFCLRQLVSQADTATPLRPWVYKHQHHEDCNNAVNEREKKWTKQRAFVYIGGSKKIANYGQVSATWLLPDTDKLENSWCNQFFVWIIPVKVELVTGDWWQKVQLFLTFTFYHLQKWKKPSFY